MDEKLQRIADDFLAKISRELPYKNPSRLFMVAMIGLPGSGRTTVARMLEEKLAGTVLLQSNSVRYLLHEADMSWGENVRQVLKYTAQKLLADGYSVVFDGNAASEEDRKNMEEIAEPAKAQVWYIRINVDPEIAKAREKEKYDNPDWISGFENFKVNTTEKMLLNIENRAELHRQLKSLDIAGLAGEIDNNGSLDELKNQVNSLIDKII